MASITGISVNSRTTSSASGTFTYTSDVMSVAGRTNQSTDTLSITPVLNAGYANWVNGNLPPNTTVVLTVWGFDANGVKTSEYSTSYTTLSNLPAQVNPSSIFASPVNQRNPKQMTVSWSASSGATGYRVYKSSDGSTYVPVTGSDGQVGNVTSYTVTVDYEWQNYWFQITATNANGNAPNAYGGPWKSNDSYSPVINTFFASDTTKTDRISVYVQGNDTIPDAGTPSGVAGAYFWRNGVQVSGAISANSSGEIFYTYTGLAPGTSYSLYCQIYDADSNFSSSSNTITPSTATNRPTNFTWTYSKTSGANFKMTASEWTAFQLKINEFRTYKFGVGNNYTFTTAYDGNDFLATHYNETRNAIVNMNSNLPPYRNSGDDVIASEINWLRDALNEVA